VDDFGVRAQPGDELRHVLGDGDVIDRQIEDRHRRQPIRPFLLAVETLLDSLHEDHAMCGGERPEGLGRRPPSRDEDIPAVVCIREPRHGHISLVRRQAVRIAPRHDQVRIPG
jgi:hypothetical protein